MQIGFISLGQHKQVRFQFLQFTNTFLSRMDLEHSTPHRSETIDVGFCYPILHSCDHAVPHFTILVIQLTRYPSNRTAQRLCPCVSFHIKNPGA